MTRILETTWNTQRPYSRSGQTIFARLEDHSADRTHPVRGVVTFEDFTRRIAGTFTVSRPELITDTKLLQLAVLDRYDRGTYSDL